MVEDKTGITSSTCKEIEKGVNLDFLRS